MSYILNADDLDSETVSRIEQLGHISIANEANDRLEEAGVPLAVLFERYVNGDLGILNKTKQALDTDIAFMKQEGECRGIYELPDGHKVSITTKWCHPITIIEEVE